MDSVENREKKKVLFLEVSLGGGHLSITTAIVQSLHRMYPEISVERVDIVSRFLQKVYQLTSRQFTHAYSLVYKATDNGSGGKVVSKINIVLQKQKLIQLIQDTKPDLIFSNTFFAVKDVPGILREMGLKIPFYVFVPDPFTIHGTYFSKEVDLTLVSTMAAYQVGLEHGLSSEQLIVTGHPVREDFSQRPSSVAAVRRSLGLQPELFTILFGGSGHGAERTLEILIQLGARPSMQMLKSMLKSKNFEYKTLYNLLIRNRYFLNSVSTDLPTIQAICVTGDNVELRQYLEHLRFPAHIRPVIFSKVEDMAPLVHSADLVVGKSGPNILFESLLAEKPFFSTYHIKGQEDGNMEFIRYGQVGFVEESPKAAAHLLEVIIQNQKILKKMEKSIVFVKSQHVDAAEKIATLIGKGLYDEKR